MRSEPPSPQNRGCLQNRISAYEHECFEYVDGQMCMYECDCLPMHTPTIMHSLLKQTFGTADAAQVLLAQHQ